MEFGHVSDEELETIDFTLPGDSAFTLETLKSSTSNVEFQTHLGLSKWQHKSWIGTLFPPGLNERQFLSEYAKHYDTIEFNATFYTIYKKEDIKKWTDQVAENPKFTFCPKFVQQITHLRRFKNVEDVSKKFYDELQGFEKHQGPAFIQVGDNFTYKSLDDLTNYLRSLPKEPKLFLEIRHKDWFSDLKHRSNLFNALKELGIGTVINDSAGRRDCVHMELTVPEVMIRFVANNKHPTDYIRIDNWVERLKSWKEKGLKSVWVFMHCYDETFAPELSLYLINKLNAELGAEIKVPELLRK